MGILNLNCQIELSSHSAAVDHSKSGQPVLQTDIPKLHFPVKPALPNKVGAVVPKSSQARKRKDMMSKFRDHTDILVRGASEELAGDNDTPPPEG
jgi:hypothetical protein